MVVTFENSFLVFKRNLCFGGLYEYLKRRMSEDIKDQSHAQNKDYFIAKPTLIFNT
jgi:hypothetical protein